MKKLLLQILLLPILPCFMKGSDVGKLKDPTAEERATAEVAARQWNEYMSGKAIEQDYLHDISGSTSIAADKAQGKAAVDLAAYTPKALGSNPNVSTGNGMMALAAKRAKINDELSQDANSQQAAAKKVYYENAMGIQSTANAAQSGLASDAVSRNTADLEADYNSKASKVGSLATAGGVVAGMARQSYYNRAK